MTLKLDLEVPTLPAVAGPQRDAALQDALNRVTSNFRLIQQGDEAAAQLSGFAAVSFTLTQSGVQLKISHGLGFVPRDVLLTRLLAPSGAKLIVYPGLFDKDSIVVAASGLGSSTLKARLLVGSMENQIGSDFTIDSSETQEYVGKS